MQDQRLLLAKSKFQVRAYKSSDFDTLVEIFTMAFWDGSLYAYMESEVEKRKRLLSSLLLKILSLKLKYRTTYIVETANGKIVGAIFWYKKNTQQAGYPFMEALKSGLLWFPLKLSWSKLKAFINYNRFESKLIQQALSEGYNILDYMAISTEVQGQGAGSLLVQTEFDASQKQFVFTSYPQNIRFYERNGYKLDATYSCFDGAVNFYALKHHPDN